MINFSTTFTDAQVREINKLIVQKIVGIEAGLLDRILTFYPNIVSGEKIGFMNPTFGLLGKAYTTCGTAASTNAIATSEKSWAPKLWGDRLSECFIDYAPSMAVYAQKKGLDMADLTGTDYMAVIAPVLINDIAKAYFRVIFMGDTAAALVSASPAGVITAGQTIGYHNLIDGIFKQANTIIAADTDRRSTISANGQATYALQKSTLTPTLAYEAFQAVFLDRSDELSAQEDRITISTNLIYRKAKRYLQDKTIPATYENMTMGMEMLKVEGETIIAIPYLDELIKTYENNGTKWNNPHRILHTTKSNLAAALGSTGILKSFEMWYDQTLETNNVRFKDYIDAKILQDNLIQYGV